MQKCECVDALHATKHKNGCKREAVYDVVLRRVPATHHQPLRMCEPCARFAEACCDGYVVEGTQP